MHWHVYGPKMRSYMSSDTKCGMNGLGYIVNMHMIHVDEIILLTPRRVTTCLLSLCIYTFETDVTSSFE